MVVVAGFGSEVAWACNAKSGYAKMLFFLALVGYITPWVGIFLTFGRAATSDGNPKPYCEDESFPPVGYQHNRPPDFVWVAVIGLFVTFTSFAVAHIFKIWHKREENDFIHNLKYEIIYSFLSFTSKMLLLANIGVGIVERSNRNIKPYYGGNSTLVSEEEETNEMSTLTAFMGIAGGISSLLGIVLFGSFWKVIRHKPTIVLASPTRQGSTTEGQDQGQEGGVNRLIF